MRCCYILITHADIDYLNLHAQPSSGAMGLNVDSGTHQHPYFMCASREHPVETTSRIILCDRYQSLTTAEKHVTSKQQQWWIPLKNPVDSGETFILIFPLILVRFGWGLK